MMTSRLMPPILLTRSSSLALPSGFSTDLSKSKNASAAKVTFSLTGAGGATGAGAGFGAATGAGAGAGATFFSAPSHSAIAVAGVQKPSRQHSSLVPFFQGRFSMPLTQLSTVCANAPDMEVARAAVAKSDATLFSFFMILLSREGAVVFCKTSEPESESTGNPRALNAYSGADHRPSYCAIGLSRNLFLAPPRALRPVVVASARQGTPIRITGCTARSFERPALPGSPE